LYKFNEHERVISIGINVYVISPSTFVYWLNIEVIHNERLSYADSGQMIPIVSLNMIPLIALN